MERYTHQLQKDVCKLLGLDPEHVSSILLNSREVVVTEYEQDPEKRALGVTTFSYTMRTTSEEASTHPPKYTRGSEAVGPKAPNPVRRF